MDATTTITSLLGTTTAVTLMTQGAIVGFSIGFGFWFPLVIIWNICQAVREHIYYKYYEPMTKNHE